MPDKDQQQRLELDALVVAARSEKQAFGQLFEAYYERILGYCLRRLNQRAAAEDVCSEVFLYVARKMPTFRGETEQDLRRWIYRIATNEANAYLRKNIRRKELWDEALQQHSLRVSSLTSSSEPNEHVDWPLVQHAIGQLNEKEQTIVTLRLLENMPHEEIAQVLKIRSGTVRVTYSRAINKLRDFLSDEINRAPGSVTSRE